VLVVVEGGEEEEEDWEDEAKDRAREGGEGVKDRASTVTCLLHDMMV
jgi:hypothetical protein